VFNLNQSDTTIYPDDGYNTNLVTSFIGDNGYPQPEIVAITTGIPTVNIKRDPTKSKSGIALNVLPEVDEENVEV